MIAPIHDIGFQCGAVGLIGVLGMKVTALLAQTDVIGPTTEVIAQLGLPGLVIFSLWKLYEKAQAETAAERAKSDAKSAEAAKVLAEQNERVGRRLEENTAAITAHREGSAALASAVKELQATASEQTTTFASGGASMAEAIRGLREAVERGKASH